MNLLKFKGLLQAAKTMVSNGITQEELKNFFLNNSVNATDYMIKDFMQNSEQLKLSTIEIIL